MHVRKQIMKALKKYTAARIKHLEELLDAFEEFKEVETLHEIRIEIKKIKAVLIVIGKCSKEFKVHKNFLPFREIFRKAGDIRDPEVASRLATRYGLTDAPPKKVGSTPETEKDLFVFDAETFKDRVHSRRKVIGSAATQVKKKDFRKAISSLKAAVKKSLFPKADRQQLHATRKVMKQLLYLSEIEDFLSKKEQRFLSAGEMLIGQWHDKQVLSALTKKDGQDPAHLKEKMKEEMKMLSALSDKFYKPSR